MPYEPSWWYDRSARRVATLLRPLGHVYGQLVARRMARAPDHESRLPVICVGNFTAGGTGKTPLTRLIARMLIEAGHRPAILSRGYGGSARGPHWVNAAADPASLVGDEPLLLARSAPVLVARDRPAGARAIEADARRFTHIVMDDGLQNPSLAKLLSIAVVDGRRGFGNGDVIPAGPLRAPLARQLPFVDAVLINHGTTASGQTLWSDGTADLSKFRGPILDAVVEPDRSAIAALSGHKLLAFAGIGVPSHFFDMLRGLGLDVSMTRVFGDHHAYTAVEAETLLEAAAARGLRLVTTEKDYVRIQGASGALAGLAATCRVVPIGLNLSPEASARLASLLAAVIPAQRSRG